ncbi:MAG: type II secretion system F family protein [Candidatus Aminicenantales bacterium]
MPHFLCRVATEDGHILSHSFFASSQEECRKHFESEGFCVLSVKKEWKGIRAFSFLSERKIRDRDFIMFNQEFIALVKSGYPVLKSLEIISGRIKHPALKEILMKVEKDIRQGKSLSEAFAPYETKLSKIYTASLMAGEQSGNLPGTLGRFIQYARVISQAKSRIKSALIYPTLLLFFSFSLLIILINFILPRFVDFYANYEAQMPLITTGLITLATFVRSHLIFIAALIFALFCLYFWMKKKERTLVLLDKYKLKIPYARGIWIESAISLFCRSLSLLLEAGISLVPALNVSSQAIPNKFLTAKTNPLPESIKNGESLSEALTRTEFFSSLALDMVRIGETSANLGGMLQEIADVYDARIQAKVDTFVSLIEPVLIIGMGLIVAFILLSVYLPIFNIVRIAR